MTTMADAMREWVGAVLEHFDEHLADPTEPLMIQHQKETP